MVGVLAVLVVVTVVVVVVVVLLLVVLVLVVVLVVVALGIVVVIFFIGFITQVTNLDKIGIVDACLYWWGWFWCNNKASKADFVLGLGVAKLNIHNANVKSFILSIKPFLRTVCSLRYSVKVGFLNHSFF